VVGRKETKGRTTTNSSFLFGVKSLFYFEERILIREGGKPAEEREGEKVSFYRTGREALFAFLCMEEKGGETVSRRIDCLTCCGRKEKKRKKNGESPPLSKRKNAKKKGRWGGKTLLDESKRSDSFLNDSYNKPDFPERATTREENYLLPQKKEGGEKVKESEG